LGEQLIYSSHAMATKTTAREQTRILQQRVRDYSLERYRDLFGHGWDQSVAASHREWLDRSNKKEKDAFRAFSGLHASLQKLRDYYRAYPPPGAAAIDVDRRHVSISAGASAMNNDESWNHDDSSSHHGDLLDTIEPGVETILRHLQGRYVSSTPLVWDARMRIVVLYDNEYNLGVLRRRSSPAAPPTRLTPTELAWISILFGEWPGTTVLSSADWKPGDVVREESKNIDDARSRRRKRANDVDMFVARARDAPDN
jgi:hypothetical protein